MEDRHMRVLAFVVLMMIFAPVNANADPFSQCRGENQQWYACETDEDCQVISDPCGWPWDSANKEFAAQAQQCNISKGAVLNCVRYDESMGAHVPECINNKCSSKREQ